MCLLSTFYWHTSYLLSSLHVGLDNFPISVIISWIVYRINLPENFRCIHPVFHVSYLRSHIGPVPTRLPPPLPLNDDTAGEFEVEDTLDFRLGRYGTEYLAKWLSYLVFKAMWEPAEHLAHALIFFVGFFLAENRALSIWGGHFKVDI